MGILTTTLAGRSTGALVHGQSPAIKKVNETVEHVARTNIPVLLFGESGTGKEIYGRLIHRLSENCHAPLKKLNCRAIEPAELCARLKSDFSANSKGFENGLGTLFLDGIDELDLTSQKLLLSLLPDGENHENSRSSARLITSTSRNLNEESAAGRFRKELYFRISGICIELPPLRDRKDDIPALMEHFLAKHAAELGREVPILAQTEMDLLSMHDWPGNIRELENVAKKIAALGEVQKALDGFRPIAKGERELLRESNGLSLKVAARAASRRAERDMISQALERTHWNRKRAARDLQISYKSLLYKIRQTGVDGKHEKTGVKEQQ